MYQTILVPLDGSKRAEVILPHVQEIARLYQAKVVLLQVLEPQRSVVTAESLYIPGQEEIERQSQLAQNYLVARQKDLKELGLDVQTQLSYGPVVEGIIQAAEQIQADLVAMASHGRTGLSWVFYGSVSSGLLNRIDRPLLLIRSK